jgi:hypothetical protein
MVMMQYEERASDEIEDLNIYLPVVAAVKKKYWLQFDHNSKEGKKWHTVLQSRFQSEKEYIITIKRPKIWD